MKNSSRQFLELVSNYCSNQLTYYKYNKHTLMISDKYRSGRVTALNYIQELTFYYFQKEELLRQQFISDLTRQIAHTASLQEGDYKKGIHDAINNIINEIKRQ